MTKKKVYTAINIQTPISQLILNGEKTIETRKYKIPEKYLGEEMLLMETPGKSEKFEARIIAIIRFDRCFQYKTKKEFYSETEQHQVTKDSIWAWKDGEKWGWDVKVIKKISPPLLLKNKRKGIVYTKDVTI